MWMSACKPLQGRSAPADPGMERFVDKIMALPASDRAVLAKVAEAKLAKGGH